MTDQNENGALKRGTGNAGGDKATEAAIRETIGTKAATADVEVLDDDQVNPLAPPVNTEAGA